LQLAMHLTPPHLRTDQMAVDLAVEAVESFANRAAALLFADVIPNHALFLRQGLTINAPASNAFHQTPEEDAGVQYTYAPEQWWVPVGSDGGAGGAIAGGYHARTEFNLYTRCTNALYSYGDVLVQRLLLCAVTIQRSGRKNLSDNDLRFLQSTQKHASRLNVNRMFYAPLE
jgi:hypothetical protein